MPCHISPIARLIHGLYCDGMLNLILSVAFFSACLLLFGAWKLWRRDGASQKMWLMVVAALVIFTNIAIWIVPDQQGKSLASEAS